MVRWSLVALLAIPVLDIVLLIYVAGLIGGVATVALVVLTALVGLMLVRAEGRYTLSRIQARFASGEIPADELLDGGLLIAAGAFLLTPGLVTDLVGLLLVLPPTRYPIRVALKRWVVGPMIEERTGGVFSGNVYTFEFPGQSGVGDVDGGFGPGGAGPDDAGSGEAFDLGEDAYHVDIEEPESDDRDPANGNA